MNLNENQVQIIDSLKTEFLRINETNKQHKVGTLIDFNQMASDREDMRKKRFEDRAIGIANESRCEEEFHKSIDILNEDLKYVGLKFKRDLQVGSVRCGSCEIKVNTYADLVYYGGYFESENHTLDTFRFALRTHHGMIKAYHNKYLTFLTIEELANSSEFVQFVKDNGDFDSATIHHSEQKEVSHA